MLQPIEQIITAPFERLFCHWDAVDPDSGAFLFRTAGRGKGGLPKFILILPTKTPTERGGLFTEYEWEYKDRKFIRVWSLAEAITIGNERLAKMVARRIATGE